MIFLDVAGTEQTFGQTTAAQLICTLPSQSHTDSLLKTTSRDSGRASAYWYSPTWGVVIQIVNCGGRGGLDLASFVSRVGQSGQRSRILWHWPPRVCSHPSLTHVESAHQHGRGQKRCGWPTAAAPTCNVAQLSLDPSAVSNSETRSARLVCLSNFHSSVRVGINL